MYAYNKELRVHISAKHFYPSLATGHLFSFFPKYFQFRGTQTITARPVLREVGEYLTVVSIIAVQNFAQQFRSFRFISCIRMTLIRIGYSFSYISLTFDWYFNV